MAPRTESEKWTTEEGCPSCLALTEYGVDDIIFYYWTESGLDGYGSSTFYRVKLQCPKCKHVFRMTTWNEVPDYMVAYLQEKYDKKQQQRKEARLAKLTGIKRWLVKHFT